MFFFGLFASLGAGTQETVAKESYLQRASLTTPHVGENGRSPSFAFTGSYLVTTNSDNDYSQLGYLAPNTSGVMLTYEPVPSKNFRIEVSFTFADSESEGTVGFWLTDHAVPGRYFGRDPDIMGVGVTLSGGKTKTFEVVTTGGRSVGKKTKVSVKNGISFIELKKEGDNLHVTFKNKGNSVEVFSGIAQFPDKPLFAISASSGSSANPVRVLNISTFALPRHRKHYAKGEAKSNNWLVLIVCAIGILYLAYYLYNKQAKSFSSME